MKVFFNALIVHLLLNFYVFVRGWKILPAKKSYKIPYATLFIVELVIYLTGFLLNVKLPEYILRPILLIGTSWMVLIGYLCGLLLIYDFIRFSGRWIGPIKRWNLQCLRKRRIAFVASCIIVFAAMGYGSYRFWHPVVNEYNLTVDKKAGDISKLRVLMVADLHTGYLINKGVLGMYVDKIMEQKPDIILLVGDIIDYDLPPLENQHMEEEFRRLKAPYGVYASTGNHEYRLNAEEKIAWLSNPAGMNVLRDECKKIADSFYLIGREDDKCTDRKSLAEVMQNADKNYPLIVMNHEPNYLKEESDQHIDLALYGHTHNGQLFPYNLLINLFYEVGHGYKKKEDTHIYVTSGLGLSGPQYRIGTISEIVVLNLSFKKE